MKKLAVLLLTLFSVLSLAACQKEEANDVNDNKENEDVVVSTYEADVIVIGAGNAGMSAAIEAANAGADVIIFEKMAIAGGNSAYATGGINASGTRFQEELCTTDGETYCDSNDTFYEDTMKGGYNLNNPDLVRKLVDESAATVEWLVDELGADLTKVKSFGGHSVRRTHYPSDGSPVGSEIVSSLLGGLDARSEDIKLVLNTKVVSVSLDTEGNVNGVIIEQNGEQFYAKANAVVIAAGGFGNNPEMIVKFDPTKEGFISTNHPGATGDGIAIGEEIGVGFVDLDQIQIHPTVNQAKSKMITEGVRADGAFLANEAGSRFTNELLTRDVVSADVLAQTGGFAWEVFSQVIRDERAKTHDGYERLGIVFEGSSLEELASAIGVDATALEASRNEMEVCVADNNSDECRGRSDVNLNLKEGAYAADQVWYAIKISPATHHTMGGIEINVNAEVINEAGNVFTGLYAAGEVTGGIHGGNRLGGNAMLDTVLFGRTAGTNAAEFALAISDVDFVEPVREAPVCNAEGIYVPGTYDVTGNGKMGEDSITLTVVVNDEGLIESIVTKEHLETESIYAGAEVLFDTIKCANGVKGVDTVAGATLSSEGILMAVDKLPKK